MTKKNKKNKNKKTGLQESRSAIIRERNNLRQSKDEKALKESLTSLYSSVREMITYLDRMIDSRGYPPVPKTMKDMDMAVRMKLAALRLQLDVINSAGKMVKDVEAPTTIRADVVQIAQLVGNEVRRTTSLVQDGSPVIPRIYEEEKPEEVEVVDVEIKKKADVKDVIPAVVKQAPPANLIPRPPVRRYTDEEKQEKKKKAFAVSGDGD